jgi:hypothetical protein
LFFASQAVGIDNSPIRAASASVGRSDAPFDKLLFTRPLPQSDATGVGSIAGDNGSEPLLL